MAKIKIKEFHYFEWECPICNADNTESSTEGPSYCESCGEAFEEEDFDDRIADGMEG